VRNADGTEELYLDAGDPLQLHNLAGGARVAHVLDRLQTLAESLARAEGGG
jgi:hypothetical protein